MLNVHYNSITIISILILEPILIYGVLMSFNILLVFKFNLVLSFFLPIFLSINCSHTIVFILIIKRSCLIFHWFMISRFLFILMWRDTWLVNFISLDSPIKDKFMFKSTLIIKFFEVSTDKSIVRCFIELQLSTVTHKYSKFLYKRLF